MEKECNTIQQTVKRRKKKPMSKTRLAFILFCCAIPVIHWLIFYVYVNMSSFTMAFQNNQGAFSLVHFERLWRELTAPHTELRIAIKNTLLTFFITLAAFPFRVLVSYFLYKKVPGSAVYRVLFFLPSIIFSVAMAMVITRILGVNGFIAKGVQEIFDLKQTPELLGDSLYANKTVLLHMLWIGFPGDLIIWGGTFARIPEEVLESGKLDGVNWWTEFTRIIVPIVWPTVALKMVLTFCNIFSATGAVFLLTGGAYGTMTIACWMYKEVLKYTGNTIGYHYLSAVGLVTTAIAITISLFIRKWTDKAFDEVEY